MITSHISERLNISERQVANVIKLLDEGATIPFIARYRKEATRSLDEVVIADIDREYRLLQEIIKRKTTIMAAIEEQGHLTEQLRQRIEVCFDRNELEDIYMPFKPRRRTRAQIAVERGLEPLAKIIIRQGDRNIEQIAEKYVSGEVTSAEMAIDGASDIIAENVSENSYVRNAVRRLFAAEAIITSKLVKGKDAEGQKYKDYFNYSSPLKRIRSHTLLAIRRAEAEGCLKVDISVDIDRAINRIETVYAKGGNSMCGTVRAAIADSYKRLIKPSIETEMAALSKERADREAIDIFAENLRQLLLAPPLGQKRVLAIDPGFRTGCKVVILNEQGDLLHNETIYPHPPVYKAHEASRKLVSLVEAYKVSAIAIGNGTAGRETENFVRKIRFTVDGIEVFSVNESGASIYSASKTAREEFPDYDVTVRGAVSLGRRLIDPLAELVKIDPKSIGVGQYQHDVSQKALKESLDRVVESCVNSVGVNINTASKYLLTYISGIGESLAQNIVRYRAENGEFRSRRELMKVPKMGAKSFEQCAGFLRVEGATNPLDNTAVHPESYPIVQKMADDLGMTLSEMTADKNIRQKIDLSRYITAEAGLPTLSDIVSELEKPSRDPRRTIAVFEFDPTVHGIEDLHRGMKLPGIVTNITKFGAFVDIGIHLSGLIHISQLSTNRINDPTDVVHINQHVTVTVLEVDTERKRIALSLI